MKELNEIFAELKKQGAIEVKNLVVKKTFVTRKSDYDLLTLRVNKDVIGVETVDESKQLVDNSRRIYCYPHDVVRVLNETPKVALYTNMLLLDPSSFASVLSFASIDILQVKITANEEYVGPFGIANTVRDYDSVRSYITKITLGEEGIDFIKDLREEDRARKIQRILSVSAVNDAVSRNRFVNEDREDAPF